MIPKTVFGVTDVWFQHARNHFAEKSANHRSGGFSLPDVSHYRKFADCQFSGLRVTRQSAITSESAVIPAHSLLDRTGNQGAFAEFILDANRKVTRLVLGQTEGDATYDRRP